MKARLQAPLRFVKSESVAANYPAATIANATDPLVSTMQFIEQLFPDKAVVMCQRSEAPSVQYASRNCRQILGYNAAEVKKMSLPEFLAHVHPHDIEEVNQCFAFINALEPYDPLLYRFELHYRLKQKNGQFVNIIDEKSALPGDAGTYLYLNCFRTVPAEEKFFDVKMIVSKKWNGDFKRSQVYIPRLSQDDFTPRQKDIVNLVSKGLTNTQIADALSVSVHTIKNHKSILFRKVNVANSLELLAVTRESLLSGC